MESEHVHDFSGFLPILKVGTFVLPTYFLVSSLAFIAALFFLVARSKKMRLSRNRALDTALVLMITGFFGARFFHVFFEEPHYYAEDPSRVLEVWRGGFVWYGGAVLGALCSLAFLKWKREPIARYLDLFAPVGALGYALGRVACLLTGCCYGGVCVLGETHFRYPTQAFAILWEFVVLVLLLRFEKTRETSTWFARQGQIFFAWMMMHSLGRIIMEQFRADPRGAELMTLSLSTWISFCLLVVAAWFFVRRARET